MFSSSFILFYLIALAILCVYAILWQQAIKQLPLTTAFTNKAVTIVWGMLWSKFIFEEVITIQKCIAAAMIMMGVVLYNTTFRIIPERKQQ